MKKIQLTLGILLLLCYTQFSSAAQFQSIASIQQATSDYIASNLPPSTNYTLTPGKIDSRLKLALCAESLSVFTQKNALKPGRNSIGVKCNLGKKWSIYTSVVINIYEDVITLSQPIRRGEVYSKNILQIEKRDISRLRSGFFTDAKNIINKQATRNLTMGAVITQSNITEPKLIKRGEKVTIKINSPNLEINAVGIALMDGIRNQNIRVKNINSKQIVQATVAEQGLVVVAY